MIHIEKAKNEFKKHIEELELDNPRVQDKIDHTMRVSKLCKQIATESGLNLTQEQIELAELIGLLHDIGRFEQYKVYNKHTDSIILDNSIKFDHGIAGVGVLKRDKYIRKYIQDDKYDQIIFTSIYEHNRYALSEGLSKEEELFSKIVKDADKIDIIYEAIYIYWQDEEEKAKIEMGELSPQMLQDFFAGRLANNLYRKSEADQILRFSSFVYDLNFKCSFDMLSESQNISKMIDRFDYKILETRRQMMRVRDVASAIVHEGVGK